MQQRQGKTYEKPEPTRTIYRRSRSATGQCERREYNQEETRKALENFYNALNYHVRLYNRPNNTTWILDAFDAMDEEGVETMTRQQFVDTCFDLGLGISTEDAQVLVEELDQSNDNRIDYYRVLETMELNMPLTPEDPETPEKSPDRCGPPKRRHELEQGKEEEKVLDASGYSTSNLPQLGYSQSKGSTKILVS